MHNPSGPVNVSGFLQDHLRNTITAKQDELRKLVSQMRQTRAELLALEVHAMLMDGTTTLKQREENASAPVQATVGTVVP